MNISIIKISDDKLRIYEILGIRIYFEINKRIIFYKIRNSIKVLLKNVYTEAIKLLFPFTKLN
jgi:hypothetical protein